MTAFADDAQAAAIVNNARLDMPAVASIDCEDNRSAIRIERIDQYREIIAAAERIRCSIRKHSVTMQPARGAR